MSDMENAVDSVDSTEAVGAGEAAVGGTDAGVAEDVGSFFEFEHPETKEKKVFKNKGELADYLRHGTMWKSQFDAEKSKVSERAKYLEDQIKKYEAQQRAILESPAMKYHKFLQERPDVAERLKKELAGSQPKPDIEKLLDQRLKPYDEKIKEYERIEAERKQEAARQAAIGRLKERYGDVDDSIFQQEMERLQNIPEQDREYALLELLYHANRGRMSPAELERRAAQRSATRRPPSVTSTPATKDTGEDPGKLKPSELRKRAEELLKQKGIS